MINNWVVEILDSFVLDVLLQLLTQKSYKKNSPTSYFQKPDERAKVWTLTHKSENMSNLSRTTVCPCIISLLLPCRIVDLEYIKVFTRNSDEPPSLNMNSPESGT